MPIKKRNKKRYPKNWPEITRRLKELCKWRCEGSPYYPNCSAHHGMPHPATGSKVVLTVAHLDHVPENCCVTNLRVWCQRCHLTYDAKTGRGKEKQEALFV